jgi:hypothetical protein
MGDPDPKDNDVTESFILVMKMIAELGLDIATIRTIMRAGGVTDDDYAEVRSEIQRRWDADVEPRIAAMADSRTLRELLKQLDKTGTKKQ